MLRRILQPLWVLLALIFLIEAWLWDHLEPVVARVVAWVPMRRFKAWLAERVDTLSPAMTLIVFIVPVIPLFPLKMFGLWLLANEYWLSAILILVFAKFLGVGVAAFIFDVTRPKLLQMAWFEKLYDWVMALRAKAHAIVDPIKLRIKEAMGADRGGWSSRLLRMIQHFRKRVHAARYRASWRNRLALKPPCSMSPMSRAVRTMRCRFCCCMVFPTIHAASTRS